MSQFNCEVRYETDEQCNNEVNSQKNKSKKEITLESDKENPPITSLSVNNIVNNQLGQSDMVETDIETLNNELNETVLIPKNYYASNGLPHKDIQEIASENLEATMEYAGCIDKVAENFNATKKNDNSDKANEALSSASDSLVQDINMLNISGNSQNNQSLSAVILNKQTDSLKSLLFYNSDDSDDSDFEKNWQLHMVNNPETFESSEDSDANESIESSDEDEDDKESGESSNDDKDEVVCIGAESKQTAKEAITAPERTNKNKKGLGSFALDYYLEQDRFLSPSVFDLSNLKIDYEKEEFLHIGQVSAILDTLVTIETIQGTPAYDLDTVLFMENQTIKKPLGAIYDVIGPVVSPTYCIRFKNQQELQEMGVKFDTKVYSAPKSAYTKYVFVTELMKIKGTDASWLDDKEMPHGVDDSSGDEQEMALESPCGMKRKRDSLEKHKKFEKTMNRCNTLHTSVAKIMDYNKELRKLSHRSPIISNLRDNAEGGQNLAQVTPITRDPTINPHPQDFLLGFNPAVPPPPIVNTRNMGPPSFYDHQYYRSDQRQRSDHRQRSDNHQSRFRRSMNFPPYDNLNWRHQAGPSRGRGQ